METALYDPQEGYYPVRAAIGEGGDFVTAPSISPLFARSVGRAFAKDAANIEGSLVFLEAAAAAGSFLSDLWRELRDIDPSIAARTQFWALERSNRWRRAIETGGIAERVFADVGEVPEESITGWIFSNELYDALPVHRVMMREGRPLELGVTSSPRLTPPLSTSCGEGPGVRKEPRFAWTSWPAPPELCDYLSRFNVVLAEGQIAEINLAAGPLHRALCRKIARGKIVSFDYGHRPSVLYHSHARAHGTLAVHSRGRRGGDPLESPGLVDLTAHVNWDDLIAAGEGEGFASEPIRRLSLFLAESGLFEDAERDPIAAARLLDPEGLGDALSVLVQSHRV